MRAAMQRLFGRVELGTSLSMPPRNKLFLVDVFVCLCMGLAAGGFLIERLAAGDYTSTVTRVSMVTVSVPFVFVAIGCFRRSLALRLLRPVVVIYLYSAAALVAASAGPRREFTMLTFAFIQCIVLLYPVENIMLAAYEWLVVGALMGVLCVPSTLPVYAISSAFRIRYVIGIVTVQTGMHLYQWAIRAMYQQLAQAIRSKDAYLATMSHEIRTPLFGVVGMSGLLAGTPLNEDQAQYVRTIQSSSETLLSLINLVLDAGRFERGFTKKDLNMQPTSVRDVIDHVLGVLAPRAMEKHLILAMNVAVDVPCLNICDRTRLLQILMNLLNNAIKFTSQGRVTVAVRRDEDQMLLFEVTDTGAGIPSGKQSMVFDPFKQVRASEVHTSGWSDAGVGLGLAISKRTVEMMDGAIGIRSHTAEEGENPGSVFWFTLPLSEDATGQESALEVVSLGGRRCLVAVPDSVQRAGLVAMLRHWGSLESEDVDGVASARELRQLIVRARTAGQPHDVVVVSCRLWEDRLRTLLPQNAFAVVLRDAVASASDCTHADAVISEPVTMRSLASTLQKQFGPGPASAMKSVTTHELNGLRVLVVEDTVVNQKLVCQWLKHMQCEYTLAEDGSVALTVLRRHPIDIVLMDAHMPVMDGFTATRAIRAGRAGERARSIVVIAMTAMALSGDRRTCLASGMDDYLSKPMTVEQLETMLSRWMPVARERQRVRAR